MTDVAALQSQLESLRTAYRTGAQSIQYEGKNISFKSSEEMRAAIASLENELNGMTGANIAPRTILIRSNKGW